MMVENGNFSAMQMALCRVQQIAALVFAVNL